MFRIVVEQDDEFEDLTAVMARYLGAAYIVQLTLETDSRRLAEAIGGLTGRPVEVDGVEPEPDRGEPMARALTTREDVPAQIAADVALPAREAEVESGKQPALTQRAPEYGTRWVCRYCGKQIAPKSLVCDDQECKRRQKREWHARYAARKVARLAAEEVPPEGMLPFPQGGPMMRILGGAWGGFRFPEAEIRKKISKGHLLEGQQIQDEATRRLFTVQQAGILWARMTTPVLLDGPVDLETLVKI